MYCLNKRTPFALNVQRSPAVICDVSPLYFKSALFVPRTKSAGRYGTMNDGTRFVRRVSVSLMDSSFTVFVGVMYGCGFIGVYLVTCLGR